MAARAVAAWTAPPRKRSELHGHEGDVLCVDLTADAACVVSGSTDGSMRFWAAPPSGELRKLSGAHQLQPVYALRLTEDGAQVASGGGDGTARLRDVETGDQKAVYRSVGAAVAVYAVDVSREHKTVVFGSESGKVSVWDPLSSSLPRALSGHSEPVHGVSLSLDGHIVAAASEDWSVRAWDLRTGAELCRAPANRHCGVASGVVCGRGAVASLLTCSFDKCLRWWGPDMNAAPAVVFDAHRDEINGIAASSDGTLVVTASDDRTVRLWDASEGLRRLHEFGDHGDVVYAVAVARDGSAIASACKDRLVRVWRPQAGVAAAAAAAPPQAAEGERPPSMPTPPRSPANGSGAGSRSPFFPLFSQAGAPAEPAAAGPSNAAFTDGKGGEKLEGAARRRRSAEDPPTPPPIFDSDEDLDDGAAPSRFWRAVREVGQHAAAARAAGEAAAGRAAAAEARAAAAEAEATRLRVRLGECERRAAAAEAEAAGLRAELATSLQTAEPRLRQLSAAALQAHQGRLHDAQRLVFDLHAVALANEAAARAAAEARACIVCMWRPARMTLQPCGHTNLCEECCGEVWERNPRLCPTCREPVSERKRVFL